MSRTLTHRPFAHTPEGAVMAAYIASRRVRDPQLDSAVDRIEWYKADHNCGRVPRVRVLARMLNRAERHNTKLALDKGDYDRVLLQYSTRHVAAWLAD